MSSTTTKTFLDDILELTADSFSKDEEVIVSNGTVLEHDGTNGFLYYLFLGHDGEAKKRCIEDNVIYPKTILEPNQSIKFVCLNGKIVRIEKDE